MRSRSRRPMARIGSESSALTKAPPATHLEELRAWMASQDLTAAYITQPVSIAYLTGVRADPFERLMALAVKPDGATLILPAIERENAERAEPDAEIVSWRDGEDPYGLVHQALEDSARLGVEKEHMTLAVAEALRERLQTRAMVDVAPEIRRLRRHRRDRWPSSWRADRAPGCHRHRRFHQWRRWNARVRHARAVRPQLGAAPWPAFRATSGSGRARAARFWRRL